MWKKIWRTLDSSQRRLIAGLFVLMILAAGFEVLGLGLILPFIQLVANPEIVSENGKIATVYQFLGSPSYDVFLLVTGVALTTGFVLKGGLLTLLNWSRAYVVREKIYIPAAMKMFSRYMHQPYANHVQLNTAVILRNITTDVSRVFGGGLTAVLNILAEAIVVVALVVTLLVVSPYLTLITMSIIGLTAWFMAAVLRKRLIQYSRTQQRAKGGTIKWVQEGLGALKVAKVLGSYDYFLSGFDKASEKLAVAQRRLAVAQGLPRIALEIMIVASLVVAIIVASRLTGTGEGADLPKLIFLGAAAVRIVPSFVRIVNSVNMLRSAHASAEVMVDSFDIPSEGNGDQASEIDFDSHIELRDVSFRYPATDTDVLRDIDLTIEKGTSVAFVGPTGAGKTTLVDVILGLLDATSGATLVDGTDIVDARYAWRKKVGYVPQDVYLADVSIRDNVVFGQAREVDDEQVWSVLEDAQIAEFIRSLPKGLDTLIGERGVRFSGGQRQRLGIARALFANPDVLVFDEATSALDNETEARLTEAIDRLGGTKTLIIIAHRLSTVRECDTIFLLEDGRLVDSGSYDDLLETSDTFRKLAMQKGNGLAESPSG
jgi:ATP-binding cassette subfamily C protein